jgi:medium-chain acyl-[acyl-carrier-protein] hydrolase
MRNPWLHRESRSIAPALRLFCFPYAGGHAQIFRTWPAGLSSHIEVCPVQLPGRGRRFAEPLVSGLVELARASVEGLAAEWTGRVAFFGHSMGALLAFEAARLLESQYKISPVLLMVAGARAPHVARQDRNVAELPEEEFIDELRRGYGTPPEVTANRELLGLVLPVLRADFRNVETYRYAPGPRLACPLVAFGGLADPGAPPEDLRAWEQHTAAGFSCCFLPGDHFFVQSQTESLLREISLRLESAAPHGGRPVGRSLN